MLIGTNSEAKIVEISADPGISNSQRHGTVRMSFVGNLGKGDSDPLLQHATNTAFGSFVE
jgi:hypothetical protein